MNGQVSCKICLIPLTRFYCFKVLFDIFYHQWREETCLVQGIPRTSLCRGSFYRGFTVLLPQRDFWYHLPPPNFLSGTQVKLSHFPREILSFKNVNLSPLDFLFNDPSSLCVTTSHHPHPTKKKRMGESPLATFPFLEARGEEFSDLEGAATWL